MIFSIKYYLKSTEGLTALALITFVICGIWVRISGLSEWYWSPDDALHIAMSKGNTALQVMQNVIKEDTHPPLYYLILHYMLLISDNILFLRSSSLIPSLCLIPLSYFMGKLAIGRAAGIYIAFVAAFSTATLLASVGLRQYSLFLCMVCGALCCMFYYNRTGKWQALAGYGIIMLIALYTHFTSVIVIAGMGTVWFFYMLLHKKYQHLIYWMAIHVVLILASLILYYYFIMPQWMGQAMYRQAALAYMFRTEFPGYTILPYFDAIKGFIFYTSFINFVWVILGTFILFCIGIQQLWINKKFMILSLFLLLIAINICLTLMELYPFQGARHSLYLWPFLMLINAFSVQQAYDYIAKEIKKYTPHVAELWLINIAALSIVFCVGIMSVDLIIDKEARHDAEVPLKKSTYNNMIEKIEKDIGKDDLIITEKQLAFYSFSETFLNNKKDISPNISVFHYVNRDFYYPSGAAFEIRKIKWLSDFLRELDTIKPLDHFASIWFISATWCQGSVMTKIALPQLIKAKIKDYIAPGYSGYKDYILGERRDIEQVYNLGWELFNDNAISTRVLGDCHKYGGVTMLRMTPTMVKKHFLK
jgi:hypothetical protein